MQEGKGAVATRAIRERHEEVEAVTGYWQECLRCGVVRGV
jgi:hypothetical protein